MRSLRTTANDAVRAFSIDDRMKDISEGILWQGCFEVGVNTFCYESQCVEFTFSAGLGKCTTWLQPIKVMGCFVCFLTEHL